MINYKEYLKLSVIYTLVAAFPNLLQLIVYPIIEGENRLTSIDFGHLAITESIITFVFILSMFSMGSGISRFYYDYKDTQSGYGKLVSTIFGGILLRGLMLMGVCLAVSPFIGNLFTDGALADFGRYGYALVITGINRAIITTAISLYRNEKKVTTFVVVNVAFGVIRSLFQIIGIFFFEMSFIGYVYGTAIGGGIVAITILAITYRKTGIHFDKLINREVLSFTMPLLQYELISWGLTFADRFFLVNTPGQLGIYDNAMKFALGIQLIIQGLTNATQPEIYRYMHDGTQKNEAEIKSLSNVFLIQSIAIIVVAIIPVMVFITTFYETDLRLSTGLIAIVFIRNILRSQYQIFALPVMFMKKTKVFFFINLLVLLVNLILNWLLIPILSYYGAIISFIISFTIQVLAMQFIQNRLVSIHWNYRKVLYFPLSIIVTASILEMFKNTFAINPFITAIIISIYAIAGIIVLYRNEFKGIFAKYLPQLKALLPW